MIIYFADRKMNILGKASTNLPDGLVITQDKKTEDIETGVATFECTIPYHKEMRMKLKEWAAVGNYILRKNEDENELYTIIESEADTKNQEVYLYAEDAGLDLLNEVVGAYEADKAYPISHYIEKFAYDSGFVIGINEASGLTRKLSWDGEATATERIASVATQFDNCEISYSFDVKGMEITNKYIHIYKKRGADLGIQLRLNYDIDSIITKESIANLATALEVTGGTPENAENPITLKGYSYDDGDFYVSGTRVYSRKALQKWSRYIWKKEPNQIKNSGHIVKTYSYDTTSQKELCSHAVTELKKACEIEVNYEVEIAKLPDNVRIGDRINIIDDEGELYVSARVLKLETSVADQEDTATLGEYLIKGSGISQKVKDLAEQFSKLSVSAERAKQIAQAAKENAQEAQIKADSALEGATEAKDAADAAQGVAQTAKQSADTALTKADQAQSAVDLVEENVSSLETTVDNAQAAANQAHQAAQIADEKAEEAAQAAANALADAADAKAAVEVTQSAAQTAVTKAEEAKEAADTAKETADSAKETADAAKVDAQTAKDEIDSLGENLDTLSQTMQADYARKTDLTEAEASLQTQITQNAAQIGSTASKVEMIDETVNHAADQAAAAQSAAAAAQTKADQATADAVAAQTAANQASQAASDAQSEADTAKKAAQTAQGVADQAEKDLVAAKADLATVTSRVDATEEEIEAAQAAVQTAQTAADKAKADAAAAQSTANTAKENAANAQQVASTAKTAADEAQAAADQAQKAADEAQAAVDALAVRVTKAETKIIQNAELIGLAATKEEVTETLGGYYTKTEADAAINTSANGIVMEVSKEVESVQGSINDVSNNLADNYYNKTQADAKLELVSDALRVTLNEEYTTKEDAIKSTVEQFYLSTSPTTLSGGSWSTAQPTWTQGKYIWRRTLVTKADGTTSYTPSANGVCITGNTGATGATGATGVAGAAGVGITSVDVQYYLSSSSTALSGGSWSATAPTWVNGKYMWSKTVTTLSNGTTKESTPVCITGAKGATGATGATGAAGAAGATGTGIASITEEYYLSTSKTAQSGGSWTTTPPTWSNGKYIWTRSKIVYKNPTSTAYTTPVCDSSWEAANGAAKVATNYMDFTTSGGLQIGNKTSGSWSGFRSQITSSAFNILNAAGAVLASYGASLIELGKNSINAIIKLCGGKGQISYDSSDGYLKVSSDKIQLLGSGDSSIITNQTISGTKYKTRVSAGGVVYREEIGNVPVAGIESTIGEGDNAKEAWIEVDPYEIVFEGSSHTILNTPIIDIRGSTTIQDTLEVSENAYFDGAAQIGYTRISDGVLGFYHGSTDARNNTNRVGYIGSPSVSNLDIYINNEAGGWVYVNSIFRCLSNIRVAGKLILEASKSTGTSMSWYWADGALHDIVSKASDGLKCYIGPGSISSIYKTVTYVRGYTLRLYNHGGGTYLGSSGSTAVTSDRNLKRDIYDINDQYVEFFMRLRPVSYKYNAKENVGHRDHIGYIAQEVEDALLDSGLTTEQFGGICIETDVDFNMDYDSEMTEEELAAGNIHYDKLYSLRYEEFIALNTHMIQKALNVIDEQQMKINELETRIAKLEKILEKQVSE